MQLEGRPKPGYLNEISEISPENRTAETASRCLWWCWPSSVAGTCFCSRCPGSRPFRHSVTWSEERSRPARTGKSLRPPAAWSSKRGSYLLLFRDTCNIIATLNLRNTTAVPGAFSSKILGDFVYDSQKKKKQTNAIIRNSPTRGIRPKTVKTLFGLVDNNTKKKKLFPTNSIRIIIYKYKTVYDIRADRTGPNSARWRTWMRAVDGGRPRCRRSLGSHTLAIRRDFTEA